MDHKNTGTADVSAPSGNEQKQGQQESKFDKAVEALNKAAKDPSLLTGNTRRDVSAKTDATPEDKEDINPVSDKQTGEQERDGTVDESKKNVNWEQRYNNLQSYADQSASKAEKLATQLVDKDPEYIHEIAKEDPKLADKLVKTQLGEQGIDSYEKLQEHLKTKDLPKDQQELYKELSSLKEKVAEQEKREAEKYLQEFKSKHPNFEGDLEKETWELFNKTQLSLEEAFDYVSFKKGIYEDKNKIQEEAYKNVYSQNVASSISMGSDSLVKKKKAPVKTINETTARVLKGLGAKKTLKKYNIN